MNYVRHCVNQFYTYIDGNASGVFHCVSYEIQPKSDKKLKTGVNLETQRLCIHVKFRSFSVITMVAAVT